MVHGLLVEHEARKMTGYLSLGLLEGLLLFVEVDRFSCWNKTEP